MPPFKKKKNLKSNSINKSNEQPNDGTKSPSYSFFFIFNNPLLSKVHHNTKETTLFHTFQWFVTILPYGKLVAYSHESHLYIFVLFEFLCFCYI